MFDDYIPSGAELMFGGTSPYESGVLEQIQQTEAGRSNSDLTPEEQELLRQFPNADINQIRQMAQYTPQTPEQAAAGQRFMAMMDLMDPAALEGIAGTSFADPNAAASAIYRPDTRAGLGSAGSWYEEGMLEAAKAGSDPTQGLWSAGYQQLLAEDPVGTQQQLEQKRERDLAAIAKIEADYNVMKPISDLLKANRFKEAFDVAKQNGVVNKLMDTNTLRELRPAFTQQEMREFFAAVPSDYAGGEFDYKPDVGVYQSMDPYGTGRLMESGYPDPTAAFKRKDDKTADYLLAVAAAAMLAAGLPPIGAAPAASGTAAGTTAAGTGAGVGGLTAAQAASLLPEVVVTAQKVSPLLAAAAGTAGAATAANALTSGAATPTATAATPSVPSPLEEVVVQSLRKPVIDYTYPLLASTSLNAGISDIPTDVFGQVEAPVEQAPTEQTPSPEEEIVVTTKPYPVVEPVVIAPAMAGAGVLGQTLGEQIGYKAPGIETTPVESQGLPEVVVKATKPPALDISDVALGLGGAGALTQGFTQPKVDPFTGEPKETAKTVEEADKIQGALKTDAPIPGTESVLDRIKKMLEPDNLDMLLKLSGLVGGAVSGGGAPVAQQPIYDPRSKATAGQWIDWNRVRAEADAAGMNMNQYLARNWNRIQNRALESSMTPPSAIPPDGAPPAMIDPRSLTPMAEGGPLNRVAGPGSGRDDKIPALLSDGEYVIDAETMALLGDGSVDRAAELMDDFRANIRKHKGARLAKGGISPDAKSPLQYLMGK